MLHLVQHAVHTGVAFGFLATWKEFCAVTEDSLLDPLRERLECRKRLLHVLPLVACPAQDLEVSHQHVENVPVAKVVNVQPSDCSALAADPSVGLECQFSKVLPMIRSEIYLSVPLLVVCKFCHRRGRFLNGESQGDGTVSPVKEKLLTKKR